MVEKEIIPPITMIASANTGKLWEVNHYLCGKLFCIGPQDPSLKSWLPPVVNEDGKTYSENAFKKALAFHEVYNLPVLADDSGLEVDSLGKQPGIHSARFGGEGLSQEEKWDYLYKRLSSTGKEPWSACFRCVLCYYNGQRPPKYFEGVTEGFIAPEPKGKNGFGYDPIFYSSLLQKTFGEATLEEKQRVSHRARALESFASWLLGKE